MKKRKKKFFFATSKIKEYWSKKDPIIFSGDWCFDFKDDLIKSKAIIIPYQWNNAKKVIKAQIFCEEIFEKILEEISMDLNKFHKLHNDSKYYRILLGNWLIHYIHQCYDKYICIMQAKKINDIYTFYINEVEDNIPYDFNEFIVSSLNPKYQIKLYSELFDEMNLERRESLGKFEEKTQPKGLQYLFFYRLRKFISQRTHNIFYFILIMFNNFNKPSVIISNPYFKWQSLRKKIFLFMRSRGKIYFFNPILKKNFSNSDTMYEFRNSKKKTPNSFYNIAYNLVKRNIPRVYLEYHQDYTMHINRFYNVNNKISWLTFQWSGNTVFQYIAALKYYNSNILLAQHGSGYGMDKIHSLEKNERAVSNKYFTYGWKESKKTIPLSQPDINFGKKIERNKKTILFVSTSRPMHLVRFHNGSNASQNLIDNVEYSTIFLQELKYKNHIIGRFHETDTYRWNNFERIRQKIPDLKKDQNKSFYQSLSKAKMLVSDHLGTTFYECLQANVPIIIFINKKTYIFRENHISLIEKLSKSKIIFFNPKEAALFINKKYENIDDWWNSKKTQSARKEVLTKYFNVSKDWMGDWCEKLL
jgi:putative transferase (TIGR04331 family)